MRRSKIHLSESIPILSSHPLPQLHQVALLLDGDSLLRHAHHHVRVLAACCKGALTPHFPAGFLQKPKASSYLRSVVNWFQCIYASNTGNSPRWETLVIRNSTRTFYKHLDNVEGSKDLPILFSLFSTSAMSASLKFEDETWKRGLLVNFTVDLTLNFSASAEPPKRHPSVLPLCCTVMGLHRQSPQPVTVKRKGAPLSLKPCGTKNGTML